MPHVTLVSFVGYRVGEQKVAELGMRLPGLSQRGVAIAELPSLGLLTLAGMTPEPWTCSFHGTPGYDRALLETVLAGEPTLVAISAYTASIEDAYACCSALRERGVAVVIGGLHVSACSVEAQAHCDAVVVGEGELVWLDVLADAESGSLRPEYRGSLDADCPWPAPRYDLLKGKVPPRMTVQTARGCPLACDFCGGSRLLGVFREKPVENIRQELAAMRSVNPRPLVELADDNTFAGTRDPNALLDVLEDARVRYFTEADWRIGQRPDLLARLARSGCVQVLVGFESLVHPYDGMGAKKARVEKMIEAVEAIQQSGVAVNGCFIVGADGETNASMDALADFLLGSPLAEVQVTVQTPFPGTALRGQLVGEDRLLPDRGWSHYTLLDVTYRPDRMTVAELEAGFRGLLGRVFSAEATRRRNAIRRNVWRRNPALRAGI